MTISNAERQAVKAAADRAEAQSKLRAVKALAVRRAKRRKVGPREIPVSVGLKR